ncbi:hypothetical protein AYI70_g9926, partial [Smittium culicis]
MLNDLTNKFFEPSIVSFVRPLIDMAPVLDTFKERGPTSKTTVSLLISKLLSYVSDTKFLRPRDILRIKEERIHVTQGMLHKVIYAHKEKRAVWPIENS